MKQGAQSSPEDVVGRFQVLHDDEGHVSIVQVQLGHVLRALRMLLCHGLGLVAGALLHDIQGLVSMQLGPDASWTLASACLGQNSMYVRHATTLKTRGDPLSTQQQHVWVNFG